MDGDDDLLALSDEELLDLPRPPCPQCGAADRLVPRIYGMPAGDDLLVERARRGEVDVEFAGCVVPVDALPIWRCRRCDALVAEDGSRIDEVRYE